MPELEAAKAALEKLKAEAFEIMWQRDRTNDQLSAKVAQIAEAQRKVAELSAPPQAPPAGA